MNDGDVETAPLVDADAEANSLRSNGEHSRMMTGKDDATSWGDSSLYNSDHVGDSQAAEQRPHGEVLETSRRGWELVAECIVLHVDTDQVIKSRSREAQDTRDLLGMEQVGSLIPVNPHSSEVVAKKIVERIPREEAQAVRDPVCLVGSVSIVGLGLSAELTNGLSTLLVSSRPDA
jgi:hypothetical protein